MEELKVHIYQVNFWEFTYNKNATETAKKISSVHHIYQPLRSGRIWYTVNF